MAMSQIIEQRLEGLGIFLQEAPVAVGNYVPCVIDGNLLFISGQVPIENGTVRFKGHLGKDVDVETGQQAARLCCINLLTQAKTALGDLDRIERLVRLGGFVAATPDFTDHAKVINGASDLMVEVFGDQGLHCRAAIGCSSLPLGSAVEVEALFHIKS